MSRGRNVPVVIAPVLPDDRSQDIDGAYFRAHPAVMEYTRDYIAGETVEPMPPGTRVVVRRVGFQRMRAFITPQGGLN